MTQRGILGLGLATLVVMIVALLYTGSRQQPAEFAAEPLVPGLRGLVNEIDAVQIRGAGNRTVVELRREHDRWLVANMHDYEADFRLIHDLLRELAEALRAEPRTALEEWYPRLGLSDIDSPDARGLQVAFPARNLPSVILGAQDETTGGRYARLADEDQTWLTDQPLQLPSEPVDWVERNVMDIPATELSEVTILHPDGDRIQLRPADDAGEQWVVLNVPEGREAAPRWEIRPVANGLANVRLEDVRPDESIPDDPVRALYVTHDGLLFVVDLFSDEQGSWARFSVSAEPAVDLDGQSESDNDNKRLLADAAAVDARLSPWQFALRERKFEAMTRRLEDLLQPVPD